MMNIGREGEGEREREERREGDGKGRGRKGEGRGREEGGKGGVMDCEREGVMMVRGSVQRDVIWREGLGGVPTELYSKVWGYLSRRDLTDWYSFCSFSLSAWRSDS